MNYCEFEDTDDQNPSECALPETGLVVVSRTRISQLIVPADGASSSSFTAISMGRTDFESLIDGRSFRPLFEVPEKAVEDCTMTRPVTKRSYRTDNPLKPDRLEDRVRR
jgi:hypothetical protein